jgi:hypothetical protein
MGRFLELWSDATGSIGKAVAEHRLPAGGLGFGRFVLQHVPVLGDLAVFDATTSATVQAAGRPLPENRPCAMTLSLAATMSRFS